MKNFTWAIVGLLVFVNGLLWAGGTLTLRSA